MIDFFQALIKLYPQVVSLMGTVAYDADGNEVVYNSASVQTEVEAAQTSKQAAHDTATAKLKKLGLTDDEISALKGTL